MPIQRNAANARERARMRVLSSAFYRLKTIIPWVPRDTKLSKLDTLRLATNYISFLASTLDGEPMDVVSRSLQQPQKLVSDHFLSDFSFIQEISVTRCLVSNLMKALTFNEKKNHFPCFYISIGGKWLLLESVDIELHQFMKNLLMTNSDLEFIRDWS